ncbi:MAG TPA: thioredoxin domain-containing protein [Bdellovibrionota bacterium]|jgi:protein-disulfide isomerase/uncharacterized membrane protein
MRSNTTFLKLVLILSLIGIVVSGKLLSIHNRFSTGQAALTETCTIGGTGCASVAVSDYSDIAGIPVAAIAMGYYFALLFLMIWALRNHQSANEPLYTSFFLSTLAVVVTVVMFSISNYVLRQFCEYCAMLWVVNLAVWPCLVKQLGLGWGNALAANKEIFGAGKLNLRKERLMASFGIAAGCVVVLAVLGLVAKAGEGGKNPTGESTLVSDYAKAPIVMLPSEVYGGATSKGFKDGTGAPVMEIAELADFECPGCRYAAQFLKPFLLKHGNKVRLTFRNFPLDGSCNSYAANGPHHVACALAKAGLCASKQNKFWEYHDEVYDRQAEGLSLSVIEDVSQKIGLDRGAFQACLTDPATEIQLQKDMQLGEQINLRSTPTMVINGRKIEGGRPPAELEALLNSIEKEAKR